MRRLRRAAIKLGRRKAMGVHYTPSLLAGFIADRLLRILPESFPARLRILDPACGNGVLLQALLSSLRVAERLNDCEVVGVEADPLTLPGAETRLAGFQGIRYRLISGDFLTLVGPAQQRALWKSDGDYAEFDHPFDIVIANPPYVRTQILGAKKSRLLADRYGLKGRVDLYHAFLIATTQALRIGGVIGVITSNRFLSTLAGATLRRYLAGHYDIEEVIDLGDTKLFEAAVLPAIFIGRRRSDTSPPLSRPARFMKVYSHADPAEAVSPAPLQRTTIYEVLRCGDPGVYRVPQGLFKLTQGDLVFDSDPSQVWSLATAEEAQWLRALRRKAHGVFSGFATVRVGIKTTADEVFVRSDWRSLPDRLRPESALLRPLLTHDVACRWSLPSSLEPSVHILYPHQMADGRRSAINLKSYPRARAYLESHRKRLQRRQYLLDAGRQWYEIWVPHDPDTWAMPKIVFPDISAEPRFYLDLDARLVDGGCYWISLRPGVPDDMIYLLLALANSELMTRFHDLAFGNKLYSARRRYMTQYVAKYPVPDPQSLVSKRLVALAKQIVGETAAQSEWREHPLAAEVNVATESAFGVELPHG